MARSRPRPGGEGGGRVELVFRRRTGPWNSIMQQLRGTGWLLIGALLGILVPLFGLAEAAVEVLSRWVGLPWGALGLGVLLFWAAASLYFRSHWIASLRALRQMERRAGDAATRLDSVVADGERWAYVLEDNLRELSRRDVASEHARLYLDGALSHAAKVGELVERVRGARIALTERPSDDHGGESR